MQDTWVDVFERRLNDGTAWSTGFRPDEVHLPLCHPDNNVPEDN